MYEKKRITTPIMHVMTCAKTSLFFGRMYSFAKSSAMLVLVEANKESAVEVNAEIMPQIAKTNMKVFVIYSKDGISGLVSKYTGKFRSFVCIPK